MMKKGGKMEHEHVTMMFELFSAIIIFRHCIALQKRK